MALTKKKKEKIIKEFQTHETDTGSSEVQIAIMTEEIKRLTEHLKKHPKDNSSRRGLLKMIARRKHLLDYLKRTEPKKFNKLVKKLEK